MKRFQRASGRLESYAEYLREMAVDLDTESGKLLIMREDLLEQAALIADQEEATARPGDGKETAAAIGRRIRALMGGTR